jgi:hypothetical protein
MPKPKLGPTRDYPDGKLNESDEGELMFAVGDKDGKLVIEFGTPVKWVGMPPHVALELAQLLVNRAELLLEREADNAEKH